MLWLPEVCTLKVDLRVGNDYHVQGLDGPKFVLDHNSHIEQWPRTTFSECREIEKEACISNKCKKIKNPKRNLNCKKKKKNKCKDEAEQKCKKIKEFRDYVKSLKEGRICEGKDICK